MISMQSIIYVQWPIILNVHQTNVIVLQQPRNVTVPFSHENYNCVVYLHIVRGLHTKVYSQVF